MASTSSPARSTVPGRDGTEITTYRWEPAGPPRAVVQLTHGMGEHLLRYQHLADTLTAAGFLVQGQDHRGHGATAGSPENHGVLGPTGWNSLVDDIDVLVERAHDEHPDLPVVLFGHSMGSFAAQQYLLDHSDRIAGLVLSGTAAIDLLEPAMDLDAPMDLAAFTGRSPRRAPTTTDSPATRPRSTPTSPTRPAASASTSRAPRRCSPGPARSPTPPGSPRSARTCRST